MSRYDFANLSSQDFEELTRDLLQAEMKTRLEAFKSGRDEGIDLRYTRPRKGTTIIQCKHYLKSGFAKLLSHLKNDERPKIQRLKPERYILVTSLGLTPKNKQGIVAALAPFITDTSDVMGAEDIDGLLSRHNEIERANFKLWLTSTSVIERVLHNAHVCQTEFEVQRIKSKLPLFVQSKVFPKALKLLKEERLVVIAGPPGIGKTTLAEMLLYSYLEQGYEPVVINAEISEGKTFFRREAKRIFYYDDFLGQIYLGDRSDYLGRNQDAALTAFMEMVRQSEHSRFILTTRSHILSSALQLSEKLALSSILQHRCILELDSYSFSNRARILYNHLYFSSLPDGYKRAVLKDDFFLEIIKHEHFNPRLIEWLSTAIRSREVALDQYCSYIKQLLIAPHLIWKGAFENQISDAARNVLIAFYTLGEWVDTVDLEPPFRSLHRYKAAKYNKAIDPGDFQKALSELDGAFLSYSSRHASYLNPSIREFVAALIMDSQDISEDLLNSAIHFKQIERLKELADEHPRSALKHVLSRSEEFLADLLFKILPSPSTRWEKTRHGMSGYLIDMGKESRIGFLAEFAQTYKSHRFRKLAQYASKELVSAWDRMVPEFTTVLRLLGRLAQNDWFLSNGGNDIYRFLLQNLLQHLTFATAADWVELSELPTVALVWNAEFESQLDTGFRAYCDDGYDEERSECNDAEAMTALKNSLEELGAKRKIDFKPKIKVLERDIQDALEEDSLESSDEGEYHPSNPASNEFDRTTDEDVRQMFGTLCSD